MHWREGIKKVSLGATHFEDRLKPPFSSAGFLCETLLIPPECGGRMPQVIRLAAGEWLCPSPEPEGFFDVVAFFG